MDSADDLLQDLALKLDLANMELQTIDAVLARLPALSQLKHRTEKIERACQANSELLKACKDANNAMIGLAAYLETCEPTVILENLPMLTRNLNHQQQQLQAAIRKAKGQ
jgi:ABC-type transporter Mla subunit MlaD